MQKTNPLRLELAFFAIIFLFGFQLMTSFIEGIYAFGLLGTDIPPELVSVVVLFSPLLLLVFPRGISRLGMAALALLMVTCRVAATALETRGMMLASGLGSGAFLLFLAALFVKTERLPSIPPGRVLPISLALAVGTSVLLRSLASGSDYSLLKAGQWVGWLLAAIGMILLWRWQREDAPPTPKIAAHSEAIPTNFWHLCALALGLISALLLLYSVFSAPGVMVRWSEQSYQLVLLVMMSLFWGAALLVDQRLERLKGWLPVWNGFFAAALTALVALNQVTFPAEPSAFPILQPQTGQAAWAVLILTLVSFPVILIDVLYLTDRLRRAEASPAQLSGAFSLASLFFLLGVFAQVFTTVYDYIPLVGPFFRDKYWLAFLVPGAILTLSSLLTDRPRAGFEPRLHPAARLAVMALLLVLVLGTWNRIAQSTLKPADQAGSPLHVMTYNIQQGYSADGQRDYDAQIALVRSVDPDLLGLQECDTARIANGNNDVVRYFADRLGMHAYYGPRTVTSTFGIALLSKYPIRNPQTFFMFSQGEQTATIQAQVLVEGVTFNVFVTHLGNGGPLIQQQQVLARVQGLDNVILVGDFNFRPESAQYQLTRESLQDAWLLGGQGSSGERSFDPQKRIDHIFLSPGLRARNAVYLLSPASDHPALTAVIEW